MSLERLDAFLAHARQSPQLATQLAEPLELQDFLELARGADLLIHESTFSHAEAELAYQRQHSTSTMAAQTALEAGVKQLVLTHLSPRYMPGNPMTPDDLLAEAQAIFPNTLVAKDFLSIDITPSEPATA